MAPRTVCNSIRDLFESLQCWSISKASSKILLKRYGFQMSAVRATRCFYTFVARSYFSAGVA